MTSKEDKTPFELGASVKVEIKTELPSASSGKMLDAITDLIRPVSEGMGYLADKIQLHREKTLSEIAKRAKERILQSEAVPKPIPSKFFVPLLEKASLEDIHDDTLIDMWANLIATASTDNVQMLGQYTNILANIVPNQVQILDSMLDCEEGDEPYDGGILLDNYYYLNQTGLPATINEHSNIVDAEEFCEALMKALNLKGVAIDTLNIFYSNKEDPGFSLGCPDRIYSDEKFLDFENLVSVGLIDRTEIKRHRIGVFDIDVHYYIVNPVGIDLFACCNPARLIRAYSEISRNDMPIRHRQ